MPATATGRGAQVILDGDAQRAARGAYANTYTGNASFLDDLQRTGIVADSTSPDGTTKTGAPANDYIVAASDVRLDASISGMARSAAFAKFNNPRVNAVMTTPPTVTIATTHNAALSNQYTWNGVPSPFDPPTGNGPFNYYGGFQTQTGLGTVNLPSVHYSISDYEPVVKRWETNVDAIRVEFGFFVNSTTGSLFRIIVDGQYTKLPTTSFSAAGNGFVTLDFTAVGGRKPRNIIIEAMKECSFGQTVAVSSTETVQKPGGAARKMYVLADSFGVGNATMVFNCFPGYLGDLLGIRNVWNGGVPGTGWVADASGTALKARDRIQDVVDCAPDLLLITMGYNDTALGTMTALQAEVALTLRTIRSRSVLSDTLIILCPFGGNHIAATQSIPVENAIQAAAASLGDPGIYFIPSTGGPNGPWFTGTGCTATPNGTGNCDIYISSDNTHPNDAGHAYLAGRLADEIMRLVFKT